MHEELVEDLVAIVTSFSGKIHGMRGKKRKRKRDVDKEALLIDKIVKREIRKTRECLIRKSVTC